MARSLEIQASVYALAHQPLRLPVGPAPLIRGDDTRRLMGNVEHSAAWAHPMRALFMALGSIPIGIVGRGDTPRAIHRRSTAWNMFTTI
jgi:hypothetical protein